ncbi:adenylate kinase 8 [Diretmus argenteus]
MAALVQEEVPAELLVRLIQQRLVKSDCLRQGWVLEGIPQTRQQALSLQEAGIIPDHVVMLEAPDDVLLERSQGRLVDPLTGDVYHQTFIRPPDQTVAQHLERGRSLSQEQQLANLQWYQYKVTDLSSAYHQVLKMVNADQLLAHVYQEVLGFVLTRRHSMGPYIPRILFIGPPGSGKSLQARLLSEKYNMVDVCCSQLLKSAAADGSSVGELVRPYLESGQQVPGSLVLQILTERLSRLDCSTRGWVLHGFPLDLEQARGLQESNHQPNRVFFLEITDDVSLERMTLRTTDPISGLRYHAVSHPAPTAESVYPDAVHIKADLDRHNVFEDLESRLIQGLTRPLTTDPETDQTTKLETDQTTDQ